MAGGGGGATGMRLNVMTALYLPILLYAMSTYSLEANSLVLNAESLIPHAVAEERTIPQGAQFAAPIYYEIRPREQFGRSLGGPTEELIEEGETNDKKSKGAFQPDVFIDYDHSPAGMEYDEVSQKIVFNTANAFEGEPSSVTQKDFSYRARVVGRTIDDEEYSNIVEGTFRVFRPLINVQSTVVPQLFADSRNSLSFTVQGISPSDIRLRDRSTNTRAEGPTLTWTPTGDTTVVFVSYVGADGEVRQVGEEGFRVRPAPPPVIGIRRPNETQLLASGTDAVNPQQPFQLIIRPDDAYAQAFPDDARYRISGIRFRVTRRGLPPEEGALSAQQLQTYYNQNISRATGQDVYEINLREFIRDFRGASGLEIFVDGVERVNYQNRSIPVDRELVNTAFSFAVR